ncbi:hypothetical protein PMIN01_09148 [Paraphaeosphaeria minitans]|uniref:Uncharacterized protein n=1 Tax=Paraphaeosphaeria minitans TaxID=565426 RepID=A0A9P6KNY9_9PLEO|nr:hypothetical protein PMIN01_09148 [Paraphaeosphaeria minitans]
MFPPVRHGVAEQGDQREAAGSSSTAGNGSTRKHQEVRRPTGSTRKHGQTGSTAGEHVRHSGDGDSYHLRGQGERSFLHGRLGTFAANKCTVQPPSTWPAVTAVTVACCCRGLLLPWSAVAVACCCRGPAVIVKRSWPYCCREAARSLGKVGLATTARPTAERD